MADESHGEEELLNLYGADKPAPILGDQAAPAEQPTNQFSGQHFADLSALGSAASADEWLGKFLSQPTDSLLPWENCSLPSLGIYYGWQDGTVRVRPMGQKAERALANQRLAASGQAIDMMLAECCQFPPNFDVVDLLLGDRVYLLYYIRGITHGKDYEFALPCPNCRATNLHSYDLTNLIGTVKAADPALGSEPFKIVLPWLSESAKREVSVSVRFLRSRDSAAIMARRKQMEKFQVRPGGTRTRQQTQRRPSDEVLNDAITESLETLIERINGMPVNKLMVRSFVERMHATDAAAIREWLRVNTPGIDTSIIVECPDCRQEATLALPITDSFFRPSQS